MWGVSLSDRNLRVSRKNGLLKKKNPEKVSVEHWASPSSFNEEEWF